jgi:hypothetical protein
VVILEEAVVQAQEILPGLVMKITTCLAQPVCNSDCKAIKKIKHF